MSRIRRFEVQRNGLPHSRRRSRTLLQNHPAGKQQGTHVKCNIDRYALEVQRIDHALIAFRTFATEKRA